jgi:hypothetical protein
MFKKLKEAAKGVIGVEPFRFATPGSSFDARLLSPEILPMKRETSAAIIDVWCQEDLLSDAPAEGADSNFRFPHQ